MPRFKTLLPPFGIYLIFFFLGSKYNFVQLPDAVGDFCQDSRHTAEIYFVSYELCLVVELNSTNYTAIDRQGRQLFIS